MSDIFKALLGLDSDELHTTGGQMYPEEDNRSNRAGHRLAANLLTQNLRNYAPVPGASAIAPVLSNIAGLGVEVGEGINQAAMGLNPFRKTNLKESIGDIGANLRGTADALQSNPKIKQGSSLIARLKAARAKLGVK